MAAGNLLELLEQSGDEQSQCHLVIQFELDGQEKRVHLGFQAPIEVPKLNEKITLSFLDGKNRRKIAGTIVSEDRLLLQKDENGGHPVDKYLRAVHLDQVSEV